MRTFMLAVTGLIFTVAACSSYGTSTIEVQQAQAKVASVSLTVPSFLVAGQQARATAVPKDGNGAVLTGRAITWFSSSASIANVTDSGVISAIAPGTTVVTAVSEGISGQASMAVTPPPPTPIARVLVAVNPSAVLTGQTAVATATLVDSTGAPLSGRAVTWASSNTNVATVAATGAVNAIGAGTAMISASSEGKTASSALNVSAPAPIPVASVSVSPATATLQIGGTVQLSAVTRDANSNVLTGRAITWSSGNAARATVSSSGLVTAVTSGSVSITASSEGQVGSSAITVNVPAPVPVASVSVTPASPSVQVGSTVQLSAVTRDANNNVLTGRVVTWSSSNSATAGVSASGLVSALVAGTTTVTATSEGKSATSAITVTVPAPVPVGSVSVTPASPSVQVGSTVQLSAVTRDANNNILTGRVVTWISSNTVTAGVSATGLVSALAVGTTTVTATSEGKSATSTVTVTAVPPPPPPPPGGSFEPAGMTVITERPFSSTNEDSNWGVVAASGSVGNFSIVTDATAPKSPSTVGQILFPAGFSGGGEPCNVWTTLSPQTKTLYLGIWIKLSSNWQGHPTLVNKMIHLYTGGSNHVVPTIWGSGNGTLQAGVLLQGIVTDGTGKSASNLYPNLGLKGEIVRGQWHHLEYVFVGNSSGTANASAEWYLDGVKVGSYSNMQFVSGNSVWEQLSWAPTWGGLGSTVSSSMSMSFDHLRVSGK